MSLFPNKRRSVGFPSPPRDCFPARDVRFANCGRESWCVAKSGHYLNSSALVVLEHTGGKYSPQDVPRPVWAGRDESRIALLCVLVLLVSERLGNTPAGVAKWQTHRT